MFSIKAEIFLKARDHPIWITINEDGQKELIDHLGRSQWINIIGTISLNTGEIQCIRFFNDKRMDE